MELNFSKRGNNLIVLIEGDIDHHNSEMIRQAVDAMYGKYKSKNIIFDLSEVGFMDSSAIGLILGRYRLTGHNGGKTLIACLRGETTKIYELSGLKKIIGSFNTVDEAVENL